MALFTTGPAISLPGTKIAILRNEKISDPDALLVWAEERLAELERAEVSYAIDAGDLGAAKSDPSGFDSLALGEIIHVIDDELGFDAQVRLTTFERDLKNPVDIRVGLELKKRTIAEEIAKQSEDLEDQANDLTDWLGGGDVYLDDDQTATLDDWVYGDSTYIDGDEIKDGSIQHVHLARVTEVESGTSPQAYTCELLAPTVSRTPQGVYYTGCMVSDNDAEALALNANVMLAVPSGVEAISGKKALILSEIPTAASGDVYNTYNINTQVVAYSGAY